MNISSWFFTRSKQLFNLILLLLCSFSYFFFVKILFNKKEAVSSIRGNSDIKFAFDDYPVLDFIFGWPLIIILVISLGWAYFRQFKAPSISQKIKANGIALLIFFIAWVGWLACLYYPINQFTPIT